jgi:pyridoxamine 5'-phosphate oxidase family protein
MATATATFTPAELAYLRGQRLARLGTIGPDGSPQVRPVGFVVDDDPRSPGSRRVPTA